ncbi:cathelicidin antimicrobial peptide [Phodopus roborovskii]|uniref:Camp protein n=1 Tax=Phodopus roborovskii TaxID=109678 RepID=A0AAU9YTB3_PHORO|nr:cathelicidin antimicrobial peptide [Phodopus roborovskii]CAH6777654.1 Camp [Phodopus roborovskii]
MQTQRDNPSLRWPLLLLLLGLVLPLATSKTFSSREVLLRAVDDYNQQSLDTNLYRFLDMDSQPPWDEDPDTPKYVNFRVKETVCEKAIYQIPEQCNFKEHGIVKRCVGTVILNQDTESFDIDCQGPGTQPQPVNKVSRIAEFFRRGGQKIGEKFKKIGQKIEDYFQKNAPQAEN